ncbi:uncharacterized protein FIBRA_00763 [Fibroporia radiculosa]|uniref:Uncharacterized protein n=1 Tax=Fibroporia radiculosa TaxID=599839 RepID=J4G0L2_9APHY|nr:uncharacterized protein FIBRA_00763 [Fibroporia radiculosa]CCL98758.1 predicted protein [Fibroporia radiculosa]
MAFFVPHDSRPILPPLHTLSLRDTTDEDELSSADDTYDSNDQCTPDSDIESTGSHWMRIRQTSISSTTSSCTVASRDTSPCDVRPSSTLTPSRNFSLVRTTMDKANALIVIPEVPSIPQLPGSERSSMSSAESARRGKAFLVVGPSIERFRHPERRIAKGARVHPYLMVPRQHRRQSTPSTPTVV